MEITSDDSTEQTCRKDFATQVDPPNSHVAVPNSQVDEPLPISPFSDFQSLDPNFVTLEKIGYSILIVVYCIVGVAIGIPIAIGFWGNVLVFPIYAACFLGLLGLLVWAAWVIPPRTLKTTRWRLDERGFEIRRGIWWKTEVTIPRARVQHTDVHQGPIARRFHLAKLVVHTAGTHQSSIELEGLHERIASQLRDTLIAEEGIFRDAI